MTDTDKAYAAGLFDGEGTIQITLPRSTKGFALYVAVGQTDRSVLDWLRDRWGGSVGKGPHNTSTWRIHSRLAARFLSDIEPYLQVKREQAQLAINFQTTQRIGQRLTPEYVVACEALRADLSRLNGARARRAQRLGF